MGQRAGVSRRSALLRWQSDTDETLNKRFLRKAIERAVKAIKKDVMIEDAPRIDHDVKNSPGTPEIAGTIFRKIQECGVFVADLTFVGAYITSDGKAREKRTPNANVLLEAGFAANAIGWDRVICVMNEAQGPAADLMFDMRNRKYPVTYTLRAGDPADDVLARLSDELILRLRDATAQPHELVRRNLARVDADALMLMITYGGVDKIDPPVSGPTMGSILGTLPLIHGWRRLLELGFVELVRPSPVELHYRWTYLGRLALRELKFPYSDDPQVVRDLMKLGSLKSGQDMPMTPALRKHFEKLGLTIAEGANMTIARSDTSKPDSTE